MKKLFYTSSFIVIAAVIVGMVLPRDRDARDFIYLLIMLMIFISIFSGISYIIRKIDKQ